MQHPGMFAAQFSHNVGIQSTTWQTVDRTYERPTEKTADAEPLYNIDDVERGP